MAYGILAWLLRVVSRVFFRQIEVVGLENIPATGPVIFAGNHPNDHPDRLEESSRARRNADLDAELDRE